METGTISTCSNKHSKENCPSVLEKQCTCMKLHARKIEWWPRYTKYIY